MAYKIQTIELTANKMLKLYFENKNDFDDIRKMLAIIEKTRKTDPDSSRPVTFSSFINTKECQILIKSNEANKGINDFNEIIKLNNVFVSENKLENYSQPSVTEKSYLLSKSL
ncbi:MAG: hypothetical protein LEGION0398_MBIBDBAK_00159 [Legionellaceae bacterium]